MCLLKNLAAKADCRQDKWNSLKEPLSRSLNPAVQSAAPCAGREPNRAEFESSRVEPSRAEPSRAGPSRADFEPTRSDRLRFIAWRLIVFVSRRNGAFRLPSKKSIHRVRLINIHARQLPRNRAESPTDSGEQPTRLKIKS